LTSLEVITTNKNLVADGKFNNTRDEGVLGASVDESGTFKDGGNSEDLGLRDFFSTVFDGVEEIVSRVIEAFSNVTETFSVGAPHNNNLVKFVIGLEVTDILANLFNVVSLGSGNQVVSTVGLVGSDEVRVVDRGKGLDVLHVGNQLALEIVVQNLSTFHGISKVEAGDIPTTDNEVIGFNHGEQALERSIDAFSKADSGGLSDRSEVVGLLDASLGSPANSFSVGNDTSSQGGTIVTTKTDDHNTGFGNLALNVELELLVYGSDNHGSVLFVSNSCLVVEFGDDFIFSILNIRIVNTEIINQHFLISISDEKD